MGQLFSSHKRIIELQEISKDQADLIHRQHKQIMKLKRDISNLLVENETDLTELENEIQDLQLTQKLSEKRRMACLEKIKNIIESELAKDAKPARRPKSFSQSLHQGETEVSQQISSKDCLP